MPSSKKVRVFGSVDVGCSEQLMHKGLISFSPAMKVIVVSFREKKKAPRTWKISPVSFRFFVQNVDVVGERPKKSGIYT